jgi:putative transposase
MTGGPGLARAAGDIRNGNPMWGKRKIVILLRREGFPISASTVGRILARLVARGAAGGLVQIDTLFVNISPNTATEHFTAYGPAAKWTAAAVATKASALCAKSLLGKLIAEEFYATYELPQRICKLQAFADAFAHRFNYHRPHDALGGKTPQSISRLSA